MIKKEFFSNEIENEGYGKKLNNEQDFNGINGDLKTKKDAKNLAITPITSGIKQNI
jgi:hypothetical protein